MAWNGSKLEIEPLQWRKIACFDKPFRYHLVSCMISSSRQHVYFFIQSNLQEATCDMLIKAKITSDVACPLRLSSLGMSLNQNVAYGFDLLFTIIWFIFGGLVSTRVGVIRMPSCTKPDSWVAAGTVVLLVSKNTNACFGISGTGTHSIEPFHVAVELQGGLWTNQALPSVTTQRGGAVLPVSDQWVQRVGMFTDYNKRDLMADLHTKTDLGEGCVPVGW